MNRQFAPAAYNAVKTATKLLVDRLGGADAAAACTIMRKSQICDYGNVNADKSIRADVIMDLERVAGAPLVTSALAMAQGYALVAVTPLRERSELAVLLARIGQDAGELFATACGALSHKKPTEKERAELLRELADLRLAADQAIHWLREGDG